MARGAATVVAFAGLIAAVTVGSTTTDGPRNDSGRTVVIGLFVSAAALWVGGTVDDIVQAPLRVRRDNARITPYLSPTGIGVMGQF